jgi:hypothetical protein
VAAWKPLDTPLTITARPILKSDFVTSPADLRRVINAGPSPHQGKTGDGGSVGGRDERAPPLIHADNGDALRETRAYAVLDHFIVGSTTSQYKIMSLQVLYCIVILQDCFESASDNEFFGAIMAMPDDGQCPVDLPMALRTAATLQDFR